jgi:RNA polymerase sigma factor (TIGR02999 family)
MSEITQILMGVQQGDRAAAEKLLPAVYAELRLLAAHKMVQESPGQTLDATALVHEAFLRLVDVERPQEWDGRRHFFAAAAESMRRILIENARRKQRLKRGGQKFKVALSDVAGDADDDRLLELDEALTRLTVEDPQAAKVVELHHFAGLSHDMVAEILGVTVYQARQKWTYARAWLQSALHR